MNKKISLPIQKRSVSITDSSINEEERTFEVIWTTGKEIERCNWEEVYKEVLEVSEKAVNLTRLNSGNAPFLDEHIWGTNSVIGIILKASIDGNIGRAIVKLVKDDECADKLWNKIKQGILRNISVGYTVQKYLEEIIDGVKKLTAVNWTPMELSIVAVPADEGATIRANESNSECIIESHENNKGVKRMGKDNKKIRSSDKKSRATDEEILEELKQEAEDLEIDYEDDISLEDLQIKIDEAKKEIAERELEDDENTEDEEIKTETSSKRSIKALEVQKRANEIMEVCEIAGFSLPQTRSFIKSDKSLSQIRKEILKSRSDNFDKTSTIALGNKIEVRSGSFSAFMERKFNNKNKGN